MIKKAPFILAIFKSIFLVFLTPRFQEIIFIFIANINKELFKLIFTFFIA